MTMSNMEIPVLAEGSFTEDATVTSYSENASYPDDNIYDWDAATYYESSESDDATTEWLKATWATAQAIDLVVLLNINLEAFKFWYRWGNEYEHADAPYNNTTIKKTGAAWDATGDGEHVGRTVEITVGTGINQTAVIVSNTVDTITITGTWGVNPDVTSHFDILIQTGTSETAHADDYYRLRLGTAISTNRFKLEMTVTQETDDEKQVGELILGDMKLEQDYDDYSEGEIEKKGAYPLADGTGEEFYEWSKKTWQVSYEYLTAAEWAALKALRDLRDSVIWYPDPSLDPEAIYSIRFKSKWKRRYSARYTGSGTTVAIELVET